jgi:hypothetical protein
MATNNRSVLFIVAASAALAGFLLLPACSINVKKDGAGQDKQVDIKTVVGGIHVSQQADSSQVGLAIYPGAHIKQKSSDGSDGSANVNISGFGFGLKVIAIEYQSNDSPEKILSFYKDQLKKYGNVLECHSTDLDIDMKMQSSDSGGGSNDLICPKADLGKGNTTELKVGKKDDQHIVAVKPEGPGSSFSLVYVRTHGKGADI